MRATKSGPLSRVTENITRIYHDYPSQFWVLVAASFIDRLGGALMFPFFTLYITQKFNVGMTQVGIIFAMFSISSVGGSMIGGALTDRMGRKGMLIFGLVMSATSSVLMGLVLRIELFLMITLFVGLLANAGGPAQQAMVADLLPEEKRAQGFGILRVAVNLSFTIGPAIGGFLAARSYLLLFISDAVASVITAGIVYLAIRETRAPAVEGEPQPSIRQTFAGYRMVVRDLVFVGFLGASTLMVLVYMQMNTTVGVYLRDVHGLPEQMYGYLLSINALMVVLLQFPITRWITPFRPLYVMAAGTVLYAIGFGMFGFVSVYVMFVLAMVIITIGEMLVAPVGQAIVATLAPEDMRGRYMAVYGFSWVIPTAVGPLLAGLVMDNISPYWVWYLAGIIGLFAAAAFYMLEKRVDTSSMRAISLRLDIMKRLEDGAITALEAADMLEQVPEESWSKLSNQQEKRQGRFLRIRVSDLASGAMRADLRLPVGLVNTVLYTGGNLSPALVGLDISDLKEAIDRGLADGETQVHVSDSDHIEIEME